jgi:hypothetical protein
MTLPPRMAACRWVGFIATEAICGLGQHNQCSADYSKRSARSEWHLSQPLALVLLVINLALLTVLYIGESNRMASRERALDVIFQQQNRMQERLVHCLNADDILKLLLRLEEPKTPP